MTNTIEIENLNISDLDIPTDETLQEVATACEGIATSSESVATSCDNIATACGDIAKDTTLQSTNTALGSLATDATLQAVKGSIDSVASAEGTLNTTLGAVAKDATLQATNTALGGIIKDTTGQSIDTSVGSIATVLSDVATDTTLAGVAKDTTLQATNTALGSLAADTTLQATNTALGSLMADSTGQSIASAITALGSTLGSDKANIDGSNIANPSAFRQNIGCEWETITNAISDPNSNVENIVFKKCNGVVYIGLVTKPKTYHEDDVLFTITNNAVIPVNIQRLVCWSYAADKCYTINVETSGTVKCYGKGSITGRLMFYGFYFA